MQIVNSLKGVWFNYNTNTGELYRWVENCWKKYKSQSYYQIRVRGKLYLAHRIMWHLVHNKWPTNTIDHIDHNPLNNKLANLRDTSFGKNTENMSKYVTNTSGHTGVFYRQGWWWARLRQVNLGKFKTIDEAIKARQVALIEAGFHKNHGH